ncbi:hypothetical protein LQZ21_08825 [Treponema sp. TIM-1]|uniref:hypothetical protein n=1 Tax=Treponema sp. TIM-1 TaxID=2898417 RepID=UPI003980833A
MNGVKVLMMLCGAALLIAGCAVPLGQDYLITRDGAEGVIYITDYNLQNYVPVPKPNERPIILVNDRVDLDMSVVWKNENGTEAAFDTFAPAAVYKAEITITPKPGYGFSSTPFTYPAGKVSAQTDDLGDPVRTVTVTYNNSDDWNITFITDYNLQNYVPIPLAGERPVRAVETRADMRVQAIWQVKTPTDFADIPLDPVAFTLGAIYKADIRLTAKEGYRFIEGEKFAYPDGPDPSPIESTSNTRRFEVTYLPTMSPTVIDDFNLTSYIAKPVSGATPIMSFAGVQYTGIVNWKNTDTQEVLTGPFQPGTAYTAALTLSPGFGYTFTGVGSNVFIHTGAETVTNPAGIGSVTVTVTFPPSAGAGSPIIVYDTILTARLPKPVNGVTPVTGITGPQYSGTVAWSPAHSTFQLGTAYTAVITLNAAPGYTFTGIGQDVFSHNDAPGTITNPPGSGTVTITFPSARPPSTSVMSFGPPDEENSALALLKERSALSSQVAIALSAGSENVDYSVTLLPYDTSPATVVIDGHGRTLNKTSPGTLITVGGGVTLTLQNINLQGYSANNAPLVKVLSGGKLILGAGAVLSGNKTNSEAGGIWVNNGTLTMNSGAVIKGMEARRAGGALISNNGRFIMSGGTIGGPNPGDGNTVPDGDYSVPPPSFLTDQFGGGVLVDNGFFDMYGGTIQANKANAEYGGGGVAVIDYGTFTHHGGTITGNIAGKSHSGGGVYAYSYGGSNVDITRVTIKGAAVIAGNRALAENSGGGVGCIQNIRLIIEGGTITGNIAGDPVSGGEASSGGGVYYLGDDFTMYGGIVKENIVWGDSSGGGIYIQHGTFYGGSIQGNEAKGSASGGGIYSAMHVIIENTAVAIAGNKAHEANSGGGVYVKQGYFELTNGSITGNSAWGPSSGGGIYVYRDGNVSMTRPDTGNGGKRVITGNEARYNDPGDKSAGAVYIDGDGITNSGSNGLFHMDSGSIGGTSPGDGNTAVRGANGVYVAGQFNLTGGEITGNTGGNNYGVYVASSSEYAFQIDSAGKVDPGSFPGYQGNVVFLAQDASINVGYSLAGTGRVANIIADSLTPDVTKLLCGSDTSINTYRNRFLVNNENGEDRITDARPAGGIHYGYYDE